jgi:predicted phosphoadenosine phosphosulfate sulfurtransferase
MQDQGHPSQSGVCSVREAVKAIIKRSLCVYMKRRETKKTYPICCKECLHIKGLEPHWIYICIVLFNITRISQCRNDSFGYSRKLKITRAHGHNMSIHRMM